MSVTKQYCRLKCLNGVANGLNNAAATEIYLLLAGSPISRSGWTTNSADSQGAPYGTTYDISKAFDGNTSTFWHTQFDPSDIAYPHTVDINMGSAVTFDQMRVQNRNDGSSGPGIRDYEIYVSDDGASWTIAGSGEMNSADPISITPGQIFDLNISLGGGAATSLAVPRRMARMSSYFR